MSEDTTILPNKNNNSDRSEVLLDDVNYKSYFARSVAVNCQYKQTKSLDIIMDSGQPQQSNLEEIKNYNSVTNNINGISISESSSIVNRSKDNNFNNHSRQCSLEAQEVVVKLRKNTRHLGDPRRSSYGGLSSRRLSIGPPSRATEVPVENIVNQSKIETLEWQLKEIEKSREMYRAVMKQVVTFLEKAHLSLEAISRLSSRKNSSVSRSRSEHHLKSFDSYTLNSSMTDGRDNLWDTTKKPSSSNKSVSSQEDINPEKLSQEAFRLLRTSQSLLQTQEPNLANLPGSSANNDMEFLAQLAKEFPEPKPQRATSFTLSPKLILPENDGVSARLGSAFSRKLSLSNSRRNSSSVIHTSDSARCSVVDSEFGELLNQDNTKRTLKEKSTSPGGGSISSVEDESGFSSMNSFQEIGLPLTNSTFVADEVSAKTALLRSMIHNNSSNYSSLNAYQSSFTNETPENTIKCEQDSRTRHHVDDVKLWQKPNDTIPLVQSQHKRWHSSPVHDQSNVVNTSVKVLWV